MAIVNPGNSLMRKLVAALGLEGRHVQRIVIDASIKDVVRVVVTEFADGEQLDRVIELIDRAEKVVIGATNHCDGCGANGANGDYCNCDCSTCCSNDRVRDHLICKGDPRAEEPKGVMFFVPNRAMPKLRQSVVFRHPSFKEDRHGMVLDVKPDRTCTVQWGKDIRMMTHGVPFFDREVKTPQPGGACWPQTLVGMPIFFTEGFDPSRVSPFVTLAEDSPKPSPTVGQAVTMSSPPRFGTVAEVAKDGKTCSVRWKRFDGMVLTTTEVRFFDREVKSEMSAVCWPSGGTYVPAEDMPAVKEFFGIGDRYGSVKPTIVLDQEDE